MHFNLRDILVELSQVHLLLEPRISCQSFRDLIESQTLMTYISSISAGVRLATSGMMNHEMTTATAPVPAKLKGVIVSVPWNEETIRCQYSQEAGLHAPFCRTIDHQRGAE